MICAGCRTRVEHPGEACEDARHPHRLYRSCSCQHRPQPGQSPVLDPATLTEAAEGPA